MFDNIMANGTVFYLVFAVVAILGYVYFSYSLQKIAGRTNTEDSWIAWIPILNVALMCRVAGKSLWHMIGFFIPYVNVIMMAYIWGEISATLNKSKWLGLLMVIPVANLILPGYLAFSE